MFYITMPCVLCGKQGKADDQVNWRVSQNEKLVKLRDKHQRSKEQLVQGMSIRLFVWPSMQNNLCSHENVDNGI